MCWRVNSVVNTSGGISLCWPYYYFFQQCEACKNVVFNWKKVDMSWVFYMQLHSIMKTCKCIVWHLPQSTFTTATITRHIFQMFTIIENIMYITLEIQVDNRQIHTSQNVYNMYLSEDTVELSWVFYLQLHSF